VTVQLHAIETSGLVQQWGHTPPLAKQRQSLRELHLVKDLDESNHVTTTAAAVAVEQALTGIDQEARFVIAVQRT
jgi:hypothetical protein